MSRAEGSQKTSVEKKAGLEGGEGQGMLWRLGPVGKGSQ